MTRDFFFAHFATPIALIHAAKIGFEGTSTLHENSLIVIFDIS